MNQNQFLDALSPIVRAYMTRAREDLAVRIKKWPTDLKERSTNEVVGALLARQVALSLQLINSPSNWNGHVAPLFLRTMADVFINLSWVLCDPTERAPRFALYGLGQAKLELEHRKADLATRSPQPGEEDLIEHLEDWINRQRATFLTDINLGSWSGTSTRAMADEAGCIDFYNYVYVPFSACVHSTWNHIAKYNLADCKNPLHQLHKTPAIANVPLDFSYAHLAARYLEKTLRKFDEWRGVEIKRKSALAELESDLSVFGTDQRTKTRRSRKPKKTR